MTKRSLTWWRAGCWLGMFLLAGLARQALGQARYAAPIEEPRWFKFRLSQVSAGAYAEATYNESQWEDSDISTRYTRTFVGPSLGLRGDGSVYHPNLARYTLLSDGSFGWAHDESRGGGSVVSTDEFQYLGTIALDVSLLSAKPYNAGAFVNYDHAFRDNDFFSRLLVESLRYGARAQWEEGPWSLYASYTHRDEESTSRYPVTSVDPVTGLVTTSDSDQVTTTEEDGATFGVRHHRERGESAFQYTFNQYSRTDFGQTGQGRDHTFSLSDNESLGSRGQHRLSTALSYSLRDAAPQDSDELLANLSFNAQHRPNLSSYYDFSYDHFEMGEFESDAGIGQAGLQHRLYESLTSTATVRGSDYETSDSVNDGYTRRYGAGLSEDYTKWLTSEHRLRLGAAVFVDHTDQQSIGTAINERHLISPAGEGGAPSPFSFFLNLPNVNPLSIVITDERDSPPYFVPGFDYDVSVVGSRTLITWLRPPGPGTPTSVLVDYEAEPTPGGEYDTITQNYMVRFELWKNLLGAYARLSLSDNNAPETMRVLELVNWVVGADFTWKGLRAGAEYQVYDSSESDYRTVRLFQSYGFRPDEASTLNFDLHEQWTEYPDNDRREEDYRFIARYLRTMTRHLRLSVEGGAAFRRGQSADQLLATFRPTVRYVVGRTTIDGGYWYEFEKFLNEEQRQRHMLSVRVRRVF